MKNNHNSDNSVTSAFSPEDFYWENGYRVFTEKYLLKRGYCCKSGCRHCPYGYDPKSGKTGVKKKQS